MKRLLFATCLAASSVALPVVALAGAPQDDAALSAQVQGVAQGATIAINGAGLDPLEVDRQTVYLVGRQLLQQKLVELIVEDQMEQQIKSGTSKETFQVITDDVEKQIQKTIEEFEKKNVGKSFWTELAKTGISKEEYLVLQRSTLLFDKVFFRGIPSAWPEITKEAIIASGGENGQDFFRKFEENVKEGQEVPALWLQICRQWVIAKMQEWSDVKYASDGLDPSVVISVNGKEWKTAEAARALALKIKPEDRIRALTDIALQTSLRQELQKAGHWLSDEQFAKEFAEYREPYDKTPFTVKVLALTFKGYPSFEVYKSRWRLERSYEHMIAKEINDDSLKAHLEKAKDFLADGRASAKIIRIPAFDDANGTWLQNGFELAREKAEQVMAMIESKELDFDAAMKEYSKWPEHQADQGTLT
ncbi:MAG TPA: hypothetical protein PKE00_12310, partial [Planctomycetota bacterium]|nr:hypothetical protein [Planctomycetota bacterium]